MKTKLLIIRLSSFGDIVQCMGVPTLFKQRYPGAEVHWLVRSDMSSTLKLSPDIDKIWEFDRKSGLKGLFKISSELNSESFSHIYDAHNNLRSQILTKSLKSSHFARRSKERFKRFLQFQLGVKSFEHPYRGQHSFTYPLKVWGITEAIPSSPPLKVKNEVFEKLQPLLPKSPYVTFMPSAAWHMKRWPISHWKKLIKKINRPIVLLGGSQDAFIEDLYSTQDTHVYNLSGKLTLEESSAVVAKSQLLVSADTGLLHVADQLGVPCIALIGPSAFGYPSRSTSHVLEVDLSCKPCSKDGSGKCKNKEYQKCMVDITPERVFKEMESLL